MATRRSFLKALAAALVLPGFVRRSRAGEMSELADAFKSSIEDLKHAKDEEGRQLFVVVPHPLFVGWACGASTGGTWITMENKLDIPGASVEEAFDNLIKLDERQLRPFTPGDVGRAVYLADRSIGGDAEFTYDSGAFEPGAGGAGSIPASDRVFSGNSPSCSPRPPRR